MWGSFTIAWGAKPILVFVCTSAEEYTENTQQPWPLTEDMIDCVISVEGQGFAILCTTVQNPFAPEECGRIVHECVHLAQYVVHSSGGYERTMEWWRSVALNTQNAKLEEHDAYLVQCILVKVLKLLQH